MTCPHCDGAGERHGYACPGFRPVTWVCELCAGTGEVDEERAGWVARGAAMRERRVARRETQRLVAQVTEALLCVERDQERARQAEAQVAAMREGLEWALAEGGWRLWYYGSESPDVIRTGSIGDDATISTDAGAELLAEVTRLREFVATIRAKTAFMSMVRSAHAADSDAGIVAGWILTALAALDGGEGQVSGLIEPREEQ